ncbi:MAG: single-stranded-DNA-specific exonuclease RecJ [Thermoanaerobaculia bacterium]
MPEAWLPRPVPPEAERLTAGGMPRRRAQLLAQRGIDSPSAAERFLSPSVDHLSGADALPGLNDALDLLAWARSGGRRVVVFGDYDVDGITATALLVGTLESLGFAVSWILPSRRAEGYGLQVSHVRRVIADGGGLLLTADCGTGSLEAIAEADQHGLPVVVTDHHLPGAELPAARAIVNPRLPGTPQAVQELSGAGVAAKLAAALFVASGRTPPWDGLLRLASLGTIADSVALRGENRTIARLGLEALPLTPSPGLQALFALAQLRAPFSASDVAFRIGPRLNAPGRVGDPDVALELLLTRSEVRGRELARQLEEANRERQRLERTVVEESESRLAADERGDGVFVSWSEQWHRGVVGIAAGRLARRIGRPVVLFSCGADGQAVGSGRSVEGIDLHRLVQPAAELCLRFGGHAQAIGLTVETSRLSLFAGRLAELSGAGAADDVRQRTRWYDLDLDPAEVGSPLLADLARLAPFGAGNPEPLFRIGPVRRSGAVRSFGNGHQSARARNDAGNEISLVAWAAEGAPEFAPLAEEGPFELLGAVEADRFESGARVRVAAIRRWLGRTN